MKNLTLRILSSIFLIIIFLSLLSKNNFIFIGVLQLLLILSSWEFFRLINFSLNEDKFHTYFLSREKINAYDLFLILLISLSTLIFFIFKSSFFGFFVILLLLISLYLFLKSNIKKFFGIVYIILPFLIIIDLRSSDYFSEILTFVVLFSVLTDVSSYFFGNLLGGMKIVPRISPGKTVSGFIGGIVMPSLVCILLFSQNSNIINLILSSLAFSICVQIGDLIESYFKRKCEVKDSSNLIPGHGGVLDRFDGLFLLIIIIYILKILDFNFFFIV